jgi:hypothetical protein
MLPVVGMTYGRAMVVLVGVVTAFVSGCASGSPPAAVGSSSVTTHPSPGHSPSADTPTPGVTATAVPSSRNLGVEIRELVADCLTEAQGTNSSDACGQYVPSVLQRQSSSVCGWLAPLVADYIGSTATFSNLAMSGTFGTQGDTGGFTCGYEAPALKEPGIDLPGMIQVSFTLPEAVRWPEDDLGCSGGASCLSLSAGEKATLYSDSSLKMLTRSGWLVAVGSVATRSPPSPTAALPLLKALNSALPGAAGPAGGTSGTMPPDAQ